MQHIILITYFITLIVGFITLGVVASLTIKSKKEHLIVYLVFYLSLTVDYAIETIHRYLIVNNLKILSQIQPEFYYVFNISRYVVLFSFFLIFIHATKRDSLKRGCIDLLKFISVCIILNIVLRLTGFSSNFLNINFDELIYYSGILFLLLFSIYKTLSLKDLNKMSKTTLLEYYFLRKSLILYTAAIPLLINDDYAFIQLPIRVAPFIYIIYSLFIFKHFYNYHLHINNSLKLHDTVEIFFTKHDISQREQETLKLVLNGLSNREISEELNISIHTVKAHIYKAFKKAGIKTRYELMNELK